MMALTNVVAASQMEGQSEEFAVIVVVGVLLLGLVLGLVNGGLVVLTRVPDIVVTLAMAVRVGGLRAARPRDAGRRLRPTGSRTLSRALWSASGSRSRPSS